jgi:hypothetical protein
MLEADRPRITLVRHRRAALFAALALIGSAFMAAHSLSTALRSGNSPHVLIAQSPPPDQAPTNIPLSDNARHDIPGWDSIRRTSTRPDVRANVEILPAQAVAEHPGSPS